jgi:hypothetical protein
VGRGISARGQGFETAALPYHFSAIIFSGIKHFRATAPCDPLSQTLVLNPCIHLDLHIQELRYVVERAGIPAGVAGQFCSSTLIAKLCCSG